MRVLSWACNAGRLTVEFNIKLVKYEEIFLKSHLSGVNGDVYNIGCDGIANVLFSYSTLMETWKLCESEPDAAVTVITYV